MEAKPMTPIERVARAMLRDELQYSPGRDFETVWQHESAIYLSNAKAAIAAMIEHARYDYDTSLEGCVIVVEYLQAALDEG